MRQIGSQNRAQKDSEPYLVLSLRVIMEAIDDKDTKYLRGETDDLKFWLYAADINFKLFHKKMWQRFPRKLTLPKRVAITWKGEREKYGSITKEQRNKELIEFRNAHPELSQDDIGEVFGVTKQRISQLCRRGY